MDRKPLILAPYDAELFGHWWWEGPTWLDYLIRKTAEQETVKLITLSEYLDEYPENQVAQPSQSSWGHKGFSESGSTVRTTGSIRICTPRPRRWNGSCPQMKKLRR